MLPFAIGFACWLLLGSFIWFLVLTCKPLDAQQAEDAEVAALDAIWELPARTPSQWWPPC